MENSYVMLQFPEVILGVVRLVFLFHMSFYPMKSEKWPLSPVIFPVINSFPKAACCLYAFP